VDLASRLRSRAASPEAQASIAARGAQRAARLIERYRPATAKGRPEAWVTYHVYYRAPDWIGPVVSAALGIPYLVAEASHANKRAHGAWAPGHEASARAIRRADAIFTINPADAEGLLPIVAAPSRLVALRPFLEDAAFERPDAPRGELRAGIAARLGLDANAVWLVAVAMMRPGDKLASYRLLAQALARLGDEPPWHLLAVGDGPARGEVEAALRAWPHDRARFLGQLPAEAIQPVYAAADLFAWPAVNEAYGMALLEAQAAGLPAVAGAFGGVGTIIADGESGLLTSPGDEAAFVQAVRRMIADPAGRAAMGEAARRKALRDHRIGAAAATLDATLRRVVAQAAPCPAPS
jgi:glycosyltransferase involved in cell wall biosynthesis